MNTSEQGQRFEERVQRLLQLLGYEVQRDYLVAGRQVDLVATGGLGPFKSYFLVECKDQASNVSVAQLDSFFGRVQAARASGYPTMRGIFVATTGFVREAKVQAPALGIDLLSIADLEFALLDLRPLVQSQFDQLSADRGVSHFVELRLRWDGRSDADVATSVVRTWLRNTRQNHLTVLGDFGTGKTTLLRKVSVDLAREFFAGAALGATPTAPIYIDLREFSHVVSIRQIVLDLFDRHRVSIPSYETFWHVFLDGRVVLLIDGFDELASRSNLAATVQNFREISKGALRRGKIILSCRTHYFVDDAAIYDFHGAPAPDDSKRMYSDLYREVAGRANFAIGHLNELEDGQIRQFIGSRLGEDSVHEVWQVLEGQYNLTDLSRRPVLLDLILESFEQLRAQSGRITSAVLYRVYTDIWFQRNDWNTSLTPDARSRLIEEFAARAHFGGQASFHYDELPRIIRDVYPDLDTPSTDQCDRELRRAGFLVRDASGRYRFSHRSFLEFFLARYLVRLVRQSGSSIDRKHFGARFPSEVYRFVCDLVAEDRDAIAAAVKCIDDPSTPQEVLGAVIKFASRSKVDDVADALRRLVRRRLKEQRGPRASIGSLAYALTALGFMDRETDVATLEAALRDGTQHFMVRHNALLALVRGTTEDARRALVSFIAKASTRTVISLLGTRVMSREFQGPRSRDNVQRLSHAVVDRWLTDDAFRSDWTRSRDAVVGFVWLASSGAHPQKSAVLKEVVAQATSVAGVAAALSNMPDDDVASVAPSVVAMASQYQRAPSLHMVSSLARLGTVEAAQGLVQILKTGKEDAAAAALAVLAEQHPTELRRVLYVERGVWNGRHWSGKLRVAAFELLVERFRDDAVDDISHELKHRRLSDSLSFLALTRLVDVAPQVALDLVRHIWDDARVSPALLAHACECAYRVDPLSGRALALDGLRSTNRSLRGRIVQVLRADGDRTVTNELLRTVVEDSATDVRVEAARALVAPGREVDRDELVQVALVTTTVEVRAILELAG